MNSKLSAWRASRQEELTLPSGLQVLVKRVGLLDLVASGELPKPLLGLIAQAQTGEIDVSAMPQYMGLIQKAVRAAIIAPPIADAGDAEHLGMDELPADDQLAIFNWMNAPARSVAPFRAEPAGVVAAGPGEPTLREPAVGDPGSD